MQDPVQQAVNAPDVALAAAILTVSAAAFGPLTMAAVRRLFPGRNVFFARWGFTHLSGVVLAWVFASWIGAELLRRVVGETPDALELLFTSSFAFGVPSLLAFWFAHKKDPEGVRSLGLWRGRHGRALLTGIVAYVLSVPLIMGAGSTWPWIVEQLGGTHEPQQIGLEIQALSDSRLVLASILAVVVMPFFEEILFRCFLQPLLVQNFHDRGGVVLTAVLFSLAHGWDAFLPLFALSLVLGGVMLRTQRLFAVWGIHALHNAVNLLFLILAKDSSVGLFVS